MKAVVWHGKEDLRVDSVPDPRIEEPTDAVVRVTATAICGSDLHLYSKLYPVMKKGDIIGHEAMGIVEEVGSSVKRLAPGDRVVVPFNIACGSCWQCVDGFQSQCVTTQNTSLRKGASLFGYTHLYGGVPGGQAEFLRVPQAHYGPIKVSPEGPDERYLFLSDVLPTAWQAVEYADVEPGATVAVLGLGPIGQMCVRIAKHRGAARVIGVDQVPERLALAAKWGAETVDFSQVKDVTDEIWAMTDGRLADSVIDAVGMEAAGSRVDSALTTVKVQTDKLVALHHALGVVRRGGVLSISGVYSGAFPRFPLGDLFDKQITVRMGQANVRRWIPELMPLVEESSDPLGLTTFATHQPRLSEAPEFYKLFQEKRDGCIKVVLKP
ncbi:MAG: glutathione-dependent formaldehyde dehydrogenase [Actinobacteria bacterium]|nr:glutathione-dependent formaldehyde dehydrogenase [Actinomycetota bacterium]